MPTWCQSLIIMLIVYPLTSLCMDNNYFYSFGRPLIILILFVVFLIYTHLSIEFYKLKENTERNITGGIACLLIILIIIALIL